MASPMMASGSRPKSMPDFSALLDASTPLSKSHSNGLNRPRKKPSISLAAGLIMASESPRSMPNTPQPHQASIQPRSDRGGAYSENLFYAYAQKSDYAQSPPFILTFASAAVCAQWWDLVRREYPESTRPGPQLFILKGDDMQEQIQDNPKFYHLRNKWFYTPSDGATAVIPLQDWNGNPVTTHQSPTIREETEKDTDAGFDMSKLAETLSKMNTLISENSAQIRALSVAQSSGLQRMQEINESNSTQIKSLTDNQAKLQSLIDQNASHYIALSNSAFQNQELVKSTLQTNAEQIAALANGQAQLTSTCHSMIRSIENVGKTVGRMGDTVRHMSETGSDAGSTSTVSLSAMANRISPPPRKLNRRIKGVWYEYDTGPGGGSPQGSPRRNVMLDTPPKSPLSARN